jgi:WhiB family redox-sensing transcriptional regulator
MNHAPNQETYPVPELTLVDRRELTDKSQYEPGDANAWRGRVACTSAAPEVFYPEKEDSEQGDEAKALCAECPIQEDCLEDALVKREKFGIWGGKTSRERKRILRRRREGKE